MKLEFGEPELQELYRKNGVTAEVVTPEGQMTEIRVKFPKRLLEPNTCLSCPGCKASGEVEFYQEENPLARLGIKLVFRDIRRMTFPKCGLNDHSGSQSDFLCRVEDIEDNGGCLDENYEGDGDESKIIGRTTQYIIKQFAKKRIGVRYPSVNKIRQALV